MKTSALVLAGGLFVAGAASATVIDSAATGSWGTGATWQFGNVPTASNNDDARIGVGTGHVVTVDASGATARSVEIGSWGGGGVLRIADTYNLAVTDFNYFGTGGTFDRSTGYGGTLTVSGRYLSLGGAAGSSVAGDSINYLDTRSGFTQNGNLTVNALDTGGAYNLGSHTLTVTGTAGYNRLFIGLNSATAFSRSSGSVVTANFLDIRNASTFTAFANDTVTGAGGLRLDTAGQLSSTAGTLALSFTNPSANFELYGTGSAVLTYTDPNAPGFWYALRAKGNRETTLQNYITNGQIALNTSGLSLAYATPFLLDPVFYDAGTDYTYIGFVSDFVATVPEPSTVLLFLAGGALLYRRLRRG